MGILRAIAWRLPVQREVRPTLNLPTSLLAGGALVLLAFLASPAVVAPRAFLNEPPLAVSLALVLIGLFVISRRHVLAQVVGLLTTGQDHHRERLPICHSASSGPW